MESVYITHHTFIFPPSTSPSLTLFPFRPLVTPPIMCVFWEPVNVLFHYHPQHLLTSAGKVHLLLDFSPPAPGRGGWCRLSWSDPLLWEFARKVTVPSEFNLLYVPVDTTGTNVCAVRLSADGRSRPLWLWRQTLGFWIDIQFFWCFFSNYSI